MKLIRMIAGIALAAAALVAAASDRGTPAEAQAMAQKAVALVRSAGKEKAFAEFNKLQPGTFKDRDLYVMAYDRAGNNLAHGGNHQLHGKNLLGLKDADGKLIVKSLVDVAFNGSGRGWVEYNWPNPLTRAVEAKRTYVERVDDVLIAVGAYR